MRTITLFIAMSLDGYIADARGGVDWLRGHDQDAEDTDSYAALMARVDTVLMGWNTYRQIVTELSPGEWPYTGLTCYVVTHREQPAEEGIVFTKEPPGKLAARLKAGPGKDIWVCGGAHLAGQMLAEDLIDEFDISVVPTVLGAGVRLFGALPREVRLELVSTRSSNGIVELIYRRRGRERIIRPSKETDLDALAEIWLSANLSAHAFIPAQYWRGHFAPVKERLPQAELYVCQEGEEIQGFIGLDGTYIAGLFVRDGARSRGVGKRLLDRVKRLKPKLSLCVYQKNARAAAFYRREGFVVRRERVDGETGETEYVMVWER